MKYPGVIVFAYHNFGYTGINLLKEKNIKIHKVFTHRDQKDEVIWFKSVSELCKKKKINWQYVDDLTNKDIIKIISPLNISTIFSFYYRKILPNSILKLAKYGAVNMHSSLLPKYRGRATVNWQLINGEKKGGITLHYMNHRVDSGNIISQQGVKIDENDDPKKLFKKLEVTATKLLRRSLLKIVNGTCKKTKQKNYLSTYYGKRKPKDGLINWNFKSKKIYNLIRGVTKPYPGAFTYLNGKKLIIWRAKLPKKKIFNLKRKTGSFFLENEALKVKASDGILKILEFEYEKITYNIHGKKKIPIKKGVFLNR